MLPHFIADQLAGLPAFQQKELQLLEPLDQLEQFNGSRGWNSSSG